MKTLFLGINERPSFPIYIATNVVKYKSKIPNQKLLKVTPIPEGKGNYSSPSRRGRNALSMK